MLFIIIGVLLIISGVAGLLRPDLLRKFFGYASEEAFPDNILRVRAVLLLAAGIVCVVLGILL